MAGTPRRRSDLTESARPRAAKPYREMRKGVVMGRRGRIVGALVTAALAVAGCQADTSRDGDDRTTEYTSPGGVHVTVETPRRGATVSSPLDVRGRVPGSWSFEGDFPVLVLDADRRKVGDGYATLKGEWMTESDVDFAGTITFDPPKTDTGFVELSKANPSGLHKNDDSVEIPIRFER
jgi:hypothetical protein